MTWCYSVGEIPVLKYCIHIQSLELSQEFLDQREVVHVDIAYDELSSGEYREDLVSSMHMTLCANKLLL